jgi:hypothetical protein
MEPIFPNAGQAEQFLGTAYFLFRLNITYQVMTIAEMSPGHKDAVAALFERSNDKQGIHSAGTHDPDGPDIRWILQP